MVAAVMMRHVYASQHAASCHKAAWAQCIVGRALRPQLAVNPMVGSYDFLCRLCWM